MSGVMKCLTMASGVLLLTTVPALACNSIVVSTPGLTTVYACYSDVYSTTTVLEYQPPPVAKAEPVAKAKQRKTKKRCWYTNKRGKRKYRLRYSCS